MVAEGDKRIAFSVGDIDHRTGAGDVGSWVRLATALMKNRRHQEALEVLHVAIRCEPAEPQAWLGLGYVYCRLGRFEDARAALAICRRNDGPVDRIERCLSRIAQLEAQREQRMGFLDTPEAKLDEADS